MNSSNPGPGDYERALRDAGLTDINVFHRQITGSTNDDARATIGSWPALLETASAIFVAETQTRGRGRGANVWLSPRGSISLTITTSGIEASRLSLLPLGVGVAVVQALRDLGARAEVKWPNDVLIDGGKVGGILCESSLLAGTARVFVGIGINVDAASLDPSAVPGATTLGSAGLRVDRPALVADLTVRVLRFLRESPPGKAVVESWKAVSVPWWGEPATLVDGGVEQHVTLLDLNPEGQLVARDASGVVRTFTSGEVRKIRVAGA